MTTDSKKQDYHLLFSGHTGGAEFVEIKRISNLLLAWKRPSELQQIYLTAKSAEASARPYIESELKKMEEEKKIKNNNT